MKEYCIRVLFWEVEIQVKSKCNGNIWIGTWRGLSGAHNCQEDAGRIHSPFGNVSNLSQTFDEAANLDMAPNIAASKRQPIRAMIVSKSLTAAQRADVDGCGVRSVKYIRLNPRSFGTVKAP
jgi:hypothetical protein